MSSNNTSNFQGNEGTSSNNVDVFLEVIGGGGSMIEYTFYPREVWEANHSSVSGDGYTYAADGATAMGVQTYGTEGPELQPLQVVKWYFSWPTQYNEASPIPGLEDYWAAYVAGGNSLPAHMAVPFANMFMKMMQDVVGGLPTGGGML